MDPTGLPTDNLYKFMALSGLGFIGFCIWFWWTRDNQYWSQRHQLHREIIATDARMDAFLRKMAANQAEAESSEKEYEKKLAEAKHHEAIQVRLPQM